MQADKVEIWWMRMDAVAFDDWQRLEALLDDDDHQRLARFNHVQGRQTYVAAHALARALLSSWQRRPPEDWRFVIDGRGKPEVVVPAGAPRLRLNLSHTNGLVAAALCLDHDVGIDVEDLGRKADCLALGKRFFAPSECALLQAVPPQRLTETFLSLWTLKEAYVKAIGKGLAQALDRFAFTLEPPAITFAQAMDDDAAHWLFHQERVGDDHVLALALHHPHPQQVAMSWRAVTPADLAVT
ncbi:MAG: 4'-phosphopantetheinyl transferase superfamily protein [Magnetospirillum sp.]